MCLPDQTLSQSDLTQSITIIQTLSLNYKIKKHELIFIDQVIQMRGNNIFFPIILEFIRKMINNAMFLVFMESNKEEKEKKKNEMRKNMNSYKGFQNNFYFILHHCLFCMFLFAVVGFF